MMLAQYVNCIGSNKVITSRVWSLVPPVADCAFSVKSLTFLVSQFHHLKTKCYFTFFKKKFVVKVPQNHCYIVSSTQGGSQYIQYMKVSLLLSFSNTLAWFSNLPIHSKVHCFCEETHCKVCPEAPVKQSDFTDPRDIRTGI